MAPLKPPPSLKSPKGVRRVEGVPVTGDNDGVTNVMEDGEFQGRKRDGDDAVKETDLRR